MARTQEPAAIDPEIEEQLAAEDWATLDRLRERNADLDPDEVMAIVTEVVEEVRQEMYEEERASSRRR